MKPVHLLCLSLLVGCGGEPIVIELPAGCVEEPVEPVAELQPMPEIIRHQGVDRRERKAAQHPKRTGHRARR